VGGWWPQPRPLSCSERGAFIEAEGLEIEPLARFSTTKTGPLLEHAFSAIVIAPAGCKGHGSVLIERAAVLAIQHFEAEPLGRTGCGPDSVKSPMSKDDQTTA